MAKKNFVGNEDDAFIFPLIAVDNVVLTPTIPQPVKIEDEQQKIFLEKCQKKHSEIFFATSVKADEKFEVSIAPREPVYFDGILQDGKKENLLEVGMICVVDRVLQMPGAPTLVFLRPVQRAKIINQVYTPDYPMIRVSPLKNLDNPKRKKADFKLMYERIENLFQSLMLFIPDPERDTAIKLVQENSFSPLNHFYAISHVAPLSRDDKYRLLLCSSFSQYMETLISVLDENEQKIKIQAKIHERTHHELSQQQKEAFLRTHLKQIQQELGESEDGDDVASLLAKSKKKIWDKKTAEHFNKELNKLRKLNLNNPEYAIQLAYLETFLDLPWENMSHNIVSLDKVEEILNRDHYGLEKVKERILEYMAVLKLRNDLKAPILCLYGPPGVGKTSIGKSIAEAVGREYARIALGGMHDEAEIRGHRRTYIGAMPGRFLQTLSKLEFGNPLILLDEIDKVGKDYKGDPSSALLEALDPEQNNTFHDNFIDFPYDLSKVLFIATANDLSTIPAPLRDRMEIIEMSGYIPAEKMEIAQRHLVDKVIAETGLKKGEVKFLPDAIEEIIRYYTHEAGVRQLEKKISKVARRIAFLKASDKEYPTEITSELVREYLGKKEVFPETYENNDFAGVTTGLAWTPSGGDILFIETSLSPGKGDKLTLTGNLGDVMKESAAIALQFLKANAASIGIESSLFEKYDIHIHVPEGAVPKDGPSAGITLASSIASAFTGRRMKERTAMTGELTLRGKVLPVGGIKEKIIAARQAGIKRIILSEENRREIEEIPIQYIEGLEFIYVKTLEEVFKNALSNQQAKYKFNLN